jgi:hypothetical protein
MRAQQPLSCDNSFFFALGPYHEQSGSVSVVGDNLVLSFFLHRGSYCTFLPVVLSIGHPQPPVEQILAVIRRHPWIKFVIAATAGILLSPLIVTSVVALLGFGAGGIIAGTPAAAIMAAYGGAVSAGSICAVLQSIGAAGLSSLAAAITSIVGGVAAGGAATVALIANQGEEEEEEEEEDQEDHQ